MNTAAWQPSRTVPEWDKAALNFKAGAGNDAGYGRFHAGPKAAPGAGFRGLQHVGAGGDHDPGAVGSPHRGLRAQSLCPGAVLALRRDVSSLPGTAGRPCSLSRLCRKAAEEAAFRCVAADPRTGIRAGAAEATIIDT